MTQTVGRKKKKTSHSRNGGSTKLTGFDKNNKRGPKLRAIIGEECGLPSATAEEEVIIVPMPKHKSSRCENKQGGRESKYLPIQP